MIVTFIAEGAPRSKGNWSAVLIRGVARLIPGKSKAEREALATWTETVQLFARRAMGMRDPIDGPVQAWIAFVLPRPKSVKRRWPLGRGEGDLDKLERAVYDACQDIVYTDDARICQHSNLKRYVDATAGERPHASITFADLS